MSYILSHIDVSKRVLSCKYYGVNSEVNDSYKKVLQFYKALVPVFEEHIKDHLDELDFQVKATCGWVVSYNSMDLLLQIAGDNTLQFLQKTIPSLKEKHAALKELLEKPDIREQYETLLSYFEKVAVLPENNQYYENTKREIEATEVARAKEDGAAEAEDTAEEAPVGEAEEEEAGEAPVEEAEEAPVEEAEEAPVGEAEAEDTAEPVEPAEEEAEEAPVEEAEEAPVGEAGEAPVEEAGEKVTAPPPPQQGKNDLEGTSGGSAGTPPQKQEVKVENDLERAKQLILTMTQRSEDSLANLFEEIEDLYRQNPSIFKNVFQEEHTYQQFRTLYQILNDNVEHLQKKLPPIDIQQLQPDSGAPPMSAKQPPQTNTGAPQPQTNAVAAASGGKRKHRVMIKKKKKEKKD